ncbi:hypothetical protein C7R93_19625 [Brevibacillus fortis]|uniref:Uncharacterized protein n=1 Tax=Brevibacillus fortis TaxID=2126352 RepID=A0A2P7V0D8_9BACL|nr:hypothetical protein C7R93_19625 [Brevibacillus fortis]
MSFELVINLFCIGILPVITAPILLCYAFYRDKQRLFRIWLFLMLASLIFTAFFSYFCWDTITYLFEIISAGLNH